MKATKTTIKIARLLKRLRLTAGATAREVADGTRIHVSTARRQLAAMRDAGLVVTFGDAQRGYAYGLTEEGLKLASRRRRTAPKRPVRVRPARIAEKAPAEPVVAPEPVAPSREPSLRDRVLAALGEALGLHELGARTGAARRDLIPELETLAEAGAVVKTRKGGRAIWRAA